MDRLAEIGAKPTIEAEHMLEILIAQVTAGL